MGFGNVKDFFKKQDILSESDINAIRLYNGEINSSITSQTAFNDTMLNASEQAQNIVASANGATVSIENLAGASKAAQMGIKALSLAGNMLVFMAVSKGISMAITAIDNFIHSSEKCKERVDSLMSSFNSELSTANANAQKVEELADKYEALSSGVTNLGENISLTTDEYQEYNSIVNDIADMFPQMVQGYTNEGNAILSLRGNVDLLRNSYKEAQLAAYNMLAASGKDSPGDDIVKQYKNLSGYEIFDTPNWKLTNFGAAGKKEIASIIQNSDGNVEHLQNQIEAATKKNKFTSKEVLDYVQDEFDLNIFSRDLTSEDINNVRTQAKTLIQIYNAEIQSALSDVHELANAFLLTNEDYAKLDEQSQNAASILINSIDTKIADGFEDAANVGTYVDKIVQTILTDPKANNALVGLFTMDTSDMPVENIKVSTDAYLGIIADSLGEDQNELKIRLGFERVDSLETKYNNAIQSSKDKFGGEDLSPFFTENSINTEEEIDQWITIANTCATAAEAKERYLNAQNNTGQSSSNLLVDPTEEINNYRSQVSVLKSALEDLSSGNEIDLSKLYSEFPSLISASGDLETSIQLLINDGLKHLLDILGEDIPDNFKNSLEALANTVPSLHDALNSVQNSSDVLGTFEKEMSKGISDNTLNSVASLSGALGDLVAGFYAGIVTSDELYAALSEHYETDLVNYLNALVIKNQDSVEFANIVGINSAEVTNQFKEDYGIDLENHKTYAAKKLEIENQTLQKIGNNWAKFYNAQDMTLTKAGQELEDTVLNGYAVNDPETIKFYQDLHEQSKAYEDAANSLKNITYEGLDAKFDGISSSGSHGSGSKDEQPKEFHWLKTKEEYLQKEHDNIQKILDDETQSYEDQLDAIDNLIAKDKERLDASTKALTIYQEKWEKASAKLSQEDIANIQHGNDFIGEHKGQYAKDLQEASDIYKAKKGYEEDVANITQEQNEHLRDQVKIRGEIIQAQQDEVKSQMDLLQSKMDLVEAQGGVVTERMIQKQIHLSEDLMDSYNDRIDNLYLGEGWQDKHDNCKSQYRCHGPVYFLLGGNAAEYQGPDCRTAKAGRRSCQCCSKYLSIYSSNNKSTG